MDSFKEYIYYLLTAPFRAFQKQANCWWTLARVLGKQFDAVKGLVLWVREQGMILSCADQALALHGEDRQMPRLKGESLEAYRRRLTLKRSIAQQAGTNQGIITAVKALGYDNSYIEPLYLTEPARWAEFRVWLHAGANNEVRVNDLSIIDQEVMEVKPASAMPNYGIEFGAEIHICTRVVSGELMEPLCGTFFCGAYPPAPPEGVSGA